MSILDTFSKEQKETYCKIRDLEDELVSSVDLTVFVLNPRVGEIQNELDELRAHCDHIFMDNVCVVCGREKKKK